jgi:hypothetical protein
VLNEKPLQLQPDLSYIEKPIRIIKRIVKELRNKQIPMVKLFLGTSRYSRRNIGDGRVGEKEVPRTALRDACKFRDEISLSERGCNTPF